MANGVYADLVRMQMLSGEGEENDSSPLAMVDSPLPEACKAVELESVEERKSQRLAVDDAIGRLPS
eukprot:scaffold5987_cov222-Ochromonas_danica.AAC.1